MEEKCYGFQLLMMKVLLCVVLFELYILLLYSRFHECPTFTFAQPRIDGVRFNWAMHWMITFLESKCKGDTLLIDVESLTKIFVI